MVTFTGESRTGQAIMAAAAPTLKGLSLEMGGKSPSIVFADAELEKTLDNVVTGIFKNQGEICLAGSRLYVERPFYDEFMTRLVERTRSLVVGEPLDERTYVGPMVSAEQRDRIESYLELAEADGYKELIKNCYYLLGEINYLSGNEEKRDHYFYRLQEMYPHLPFLRDFLCTFDVSKIIALRFPQ